MRTTDEVQKALATGQSIVALESTILAHGLPPGRNRKVAARLEEHDPRRRRGTGDDRRAGGAPKARPRPASELDRVCTTDLAKLSRRDLGPAYASRRDGATTVAATAAIAAAAGISVFATGGLGGVHRGAADTFDVSADLHVLAETPIVVVCSGVKSVLDIAATLEVLETRSIPVLGYRTTTFPAFYLRESPYPAPWTVQTPAEAAAVARAHFDAVPGSAGIVLANPVPPEAEMPPELHDELLAGGLACSPSAASPGPT